MQPISILLLYANHAGNKTLSYQIGWPRYFLNHPGFRCVTVNLAKQGWLQRLKSHIMAWRGRFEAVVILHSVFSNSCFLSDRLSSTLASCPQPKVFFLGNEYKLMPEKMELCERLSVALLVSQSHSPLIHRLYRDRLGCQVMNLPNTGLDPDVFSPRLDWQERPVDIGYRAQNTPMYLGHDEKRALAEYFMTYARREGLMADISLDPADRFTEVEWADFLNRCKGQIGTEAGSDYFELTDQTRRRVNDYVAEHPHAALEEIFERFFSNYPNPISGRMLSSRHIEAAGTKTVQILFRGEYGGYFLSGVHYIPLDKNFSNIEETMAEFRDEQRCAAITQNAYELAMEQLTYGCLLARFHTALQTVVP